MLLHTIVDKFGGYNDDNNIILILFLLTLYCQEGFVVFYTKCVMLDIYNWISMSKNIKFLYILTNQVQHSVEKKSKINHCW